MPTLTFTFDTGAVPLARIVDAICGHHNYQATISGSPNPETKANFARRMIGQHIIYMVKNHETQVAVKAVAPVTDIVLP